MAHYILISAAAALVGATFLPATAKAGLLGGTADFAEVLDVSFYHQTGALQLSAVNVGISGTTNLTSANVTSNPSQYSANVLDILLNDTSLTLTAPVFQDWQTITVSVSNIFLPTGQVIKSFTQSGAGAINPTDAGSFASAPFTETLSFTDNSLQVTYTVNGAANGNELYLSTTGGSDTFDVGFGTANVPEPATVVLLAFSLVTVIATRMQRAPNTRSGKL